MKKGYKQITAIMLILLIMFGTAITAVPDGGFVTKAVSSGVANITARADYMYGITWTAQKDVNGWRNLAANKFYKGNTYRIPYGQPVSQGKYVYWGVSIEDFLAAAANSSSIFYSTQSYYGSGYSTYYAMDCSAFVSYCWGLSNRTTTSSWASLSVTSYGKCTSSNVGNIQQGDALNLAGSHVVLISRVENGKYEVTEQTPPQIKRSWYTASELVNKYSSYTIYRYNKRDSVTAPPNSGGGGEVPYAPTITSDYTNYRTGDNITVSWNNIVNAKEYIYYVSEYPESFAYSSNTKSGITTSNSVSFNDLPNGRYRMFVHSISWSGQYSEQSNWITFYVYDEDYVSAKTIEHNGHIYAVYDKEMSWDFAERICQELGGHLVTITNSAEEALVENLIDYGNKDAYWIGATNNNAGDYANISEPYRWITGEEFSYSNWYENEPNGTGQEATIEHFAEIRKNFNYKWNDMPNTEKSNKGFVLEIETIDFTPTATVNYNGSKYMVFDESISWTEAKKYCESIGGHLATISSWEEDNVISNLLNKGSKSWYYIGANNESGQWLWNDNTTAPLSNSYTNWATTDGSTGWGNYLMKYKSIGSWIGINNLYYPTTDTHFIGFVCEIDYDTKPNYAQVTMSNYLFKTGYDVTFYMTSDIGTSYTVGIDDAYGTRIDTYNTAENYYTRSFNTPGNYSCYITTYNIFGLADSERIYFTVYDTKPNYAQVTMSNYLFKKGYDVTFYMTSDIGNSYTVGIDDAYGTRIDTYNTAENYYTRSFNTPGNYSCYITTYNEFGLADSERIYFTVVPELTRIFGNSRYQTSVAISDKGWESADTVVLANGTNYADALAGVPLAYKLDAPILLTAGKAQLEADIATQIEKLSPSKIIILGGEGAISADIETALNENYIVERIYGTTRYDTAVEISKYVNPNPEQVFVVTGTGYADALSISPYAAMKGIPIVYSNPIIGLSENTSNYLANTPNITAIGGEGAVPALVEAQLEGKNFNRIYGQSRYLTSYQIVDTFKEEFGNDVMFATGTNFPDALAGGVLGAKLQTPLLLTHPNGVIDEIKNYVISRNPQNVYILGGEGAVPTSIIDEIFK